MFAIRRFSATLALTLGLLLLGQGAALADWNQNTPKQGRECPDDTAQAGESQSRKRPDCEDTCDDDSNSQSRQRNRTKPWQNDPCEDTCDDDAGYNQHQRRNRDDRCEDQDDHGHKPKYGDATATSPSTATRMTTAGTARRSTIAVGRPTGSVTPLTGGRGAITRRTRRRARTGRSTTSGRVTTLTRPRSTGPRPAGTTAARSAARRRPSGETTRPT